MKKILITGVPGSGKSTLISEFLKLQSDYEVINFGDTMLAFNKDISSRDDLRRKVSNKEYRSLQLKAVKEISERSKQKNLLIDTHLVLLHPYGYTSGMPREALEKLNPDMVVIVEARANDILKRRSIDSRDRDKETKYQIDLHQQLNRAMAMSIAMFTNCAVKIIYSPQGKAIQAAKEMQNAISTF